MFSIFTIAAKLITKNLFQRTPWGGGKKEGGGKPHEGHPSQKGVLGPPSYGTFSNPPSGVSALFFLYKNPRQSRPEALWRGPKIFWRARSLVRFPPPIRFAPPHITAQLFTKMNLETINFVIIAKTLCIQLKQTRERPQKYHKKNCFRELFCNNFGQDGTEFCRIFTFPSNYSIWQAQTFVENRMKLQKSVGNRIRRLEALLSK